MRFWFLGLASLVCGSMLALSACGDDDASPPTTVDAGPETAPVVVTNDTESKQSGKILKAQTTNEYVAGATVTVGSRTAVTNADGAYEILVPRNTPYQMSVTAPDYFKLTEQEWIVKTPSVSLGDTNLLANSTAALLAALLPARKTDKGVVVVLAIPQAPCPSEEGATLTIDPPGEAKIIYFNGVLPSTTQTSVKAGSTFAAVFYNVEVGVPLTVGVRSPTCAQVPFPVEVGDVTYTGVQRTDPGDALSFTRVYLKDPPPADAGTD